MLTSNGPERISGVSEGGRSPTPGKGTSCTGGGTGGSGQFSWPMYTLGHAKYQASVPGSGGGGAGGYGTWSAKGCGKKCPPGENGNGGHGCRRFTVSDGPEQFSYLDGAGANGAASAYASLSQENVGPNQPGSKHIGGGGGGCGIGIDPNDAGTVSGGAGGGIGLYGVGDPANTKFGAGGAGPVAGVSGGGGGQGGAGGLDGATSATSCANAQGNARYTAGVYGGGGGSGPGFGADIDRSDVTKTFEANPTMFDSGNNMDNCAMFGGGGAVRIIWGAGRNFPSNAGNWD